METAKNNRICIYAICKNEKQFVEKWLASMAEADVIVVLDTGSDDGTYELLCEKKNDYPQLIVAQEVIKPWRFDVARNKSLELIPKDCNILFSTDLDEWLEPGWAKPLKEKWIPGVHERAEYKYTWSHMKDGSEGRTFHYNKIHTWDWIWKYPVHELLWSTVDNSEKTYLTNTLNLFDEIHLHHYPDHSKSRGSYLPLLELRAKESPDDYYGLIYLAHEYTYNKKYEESIALLERILKEYQDKSSTVEKASCYLFMGDAYRKLSNLAKATLCYNKAIAIEPTYREPQLALASIYIEKKQYDAAIGLIKQCLHTSYRHYTWLERDASWTYEPYDMLSIASFYAGYKRDSLAYAYKAFSCDTMNERLKNNLDLIIANMTDAELLQ